MFGPHLILDGHSCTATCELASEERIKSMLLELPALMGMTIIMPPKTMHYDGGEFPDDCGISGFVIIAESHISIHTFPKKRFFVMDLFSCKPIDCELAVDYTVGIFRPESFEHKVLSRGREFPRCIDRAELIVSAERAGL